MRSRADEEQDSRDGRDLGTYRTSEQSAERPPMDAASMIREELRHSHGWLRQTIDGITPEQAHWIPPGNANPICATYAHVVVDEDVLVNHELRGNAPLFEAEWATSIGVSEPMVQGPGWADWARRVRIDLDSFERYVDAVHAETDRWAATLANGDLAHAVEFGGRPQPVSHVLWRVISHNHGHAGEIAVLKGLQGVRGFSL
ncbi:MAG TPA: DinB family protein [Dehalococcoidia bacterium]|nr:DinB family protein [Dehalococcoidia bacterium]